MGREFLLSHSLGRICLLSCVRTGGGGVAGLFSSVILFFNYTGICISHIPRFKFLGKNSADKMQLLRLIIEMSVVGICIVIVSLVYEGLGVESAS